MGETSEDKDKEKLTSEGWSDIKDKKRGYVVYQFNAATILYCIVKINSDSFTQMHRYSFSSSYIGSLVWNDHYWLNCVGRNSRRPPLHWQSVSPHEPYRLRWKDMWL